MVVRVIIAIIRINIAIRCWSREEARVADCLRRRTSHRPYSWNRPTSTFPSWMPRLLTDRIAWHRVDWLTCQDLYPAMFCSIHIRRRICHLPCNRVIIRWASSRLSRSAAVVYYPARCPTVTNHNRNPSKEHLGKKILPLLFRIISFFIIITINYSYYLLIFVYLFLKFFYDLYSVILNDSVIKSYTIEAYILKFIDFIRLCSLQLS